MQKYAIAVYSLSSSCLLKHNQYKKNTQYFFRPVIVTFRKNFKENKCEQLLTCATKWNYRQTNQQSYNCWAHHYTFFQLPILSRSTLKPKTAAVIVLQRSKINYNQLHYLSCHFQKKAIESRVLLLPLLTYLLGSQLTSQIFSRTQISIHTLNRAVTV